MIICWMLRKWFADNLLNWKQSWKAKPYRGGKVSESKSDAKSVPICCTPMMSVKVNSINNNSQQTKVKLNGSVLQQWTELQKIQQPNRIICWNRETLLQRLLSKLLCSEDILVPNGSFLFFFDQIHIHQHLFQERHFKVLAVGNYLPENKNIITSREYNLPIKQSQPRIPFRLSRPTRTTTATRTSTRQRHRRPRLGPSRTTDEPPPTRSSQATIPRDGIAQKLFQSRTKCQ